MDSISNFGKEEEAKSEVRDGDFPMIMEVLVGSSYGMDVSAPAASCPSPTYGRDRSGVPPTAAQEQGEAVVSSSSYSSSSSCPFLNGEDDVVEVCREKLENGYGSDGSSESSIGSPGDSDEEQENKNENENENGEASSSKGDRQLFRSSNFSLDSLDDSLPIKRGLSNHYNGKSKSFGNISEVSSVKDLEKVENPFNKRRRVLIASKLSKKFFYSRLNPKSMPLLPVIHDDDDKTDDDDDDDDYDYDGGDGRVEASNTGHKPQKQQQQSRLKICSKSMSCFALGDLIEEEDEED